MSKWKHNTSYRTSLGKPYPLGATNTLNGVNFSIFSKNATSIFLQFFDSETDLLTDTIQLYKNSNDIWSVFVEDLKPGALYGYRADGPYDPAQGLRFNEMKLLIDPYAKALTPKKRDPDFIQFAYDLKAGDKDLVPDYRDSASITQKAIVCMEEFDWTGDKSPQRPLTETIIYEAHLKGFTASLKDDLAGTYLGFIKKIPYLVDLGITAVEFLPIQEFFIRHELLENNLTEFWGYNTIAFFAPESSYSTQSSPGCQINEFKQLVLALHKAGIEVILDVVYNHSGEGGDLGPTISLKGLDNPTYYILSGPKDNEKRYYANDAGSGNTLKVENSQTLDLIIDSLRYWTKEMHVDGFRFDLASVLARRSGQYHNKSAFFQRIEEDPCFKGIKLIAEPWDLTTYQVGNFPPGWSEWNGKYRDCIRQFIKGNDNQIKYMASRLTGSADLYGQGGRAPSNSINFITCHDGFTLNDLFSYCQKHNLANKENNRDGADDNHSWNWGIEGSATDIVVQVLRRKLIKNAICTMMISLGTPMILYGDECLRTQNGNNNGYCQDNNITWFDWSLIEKNSDILEFFKKTIRLRKKFPILRHEKFMTGTDHVNNDIPDIQWFDNNLSTPQWDNDRVKIISYQLDGGESAIAPGNYRLFIILNSDNCLHEIKLPGYKNFFWDRIVDTSLPAFEDFIEQGIPLPHNKDFYPANPQSVVVLFSGDYKISPLN